MREQTYEHRKQMHITRKQYRLLDKSVPKTITKHQHLPGTSGMTKK